MSYIPHHKYQNLISESIGDYLDAFNLEIEKVHEYGALLKNDNISILITFKQEQLDISISNSKTTLTLSELIFRKYPNYLQLIKDHPEKAVFQTGSEVSNPENNFKQHLKTAFHFIRKNFSDVFHGQF